MNNSMRVEETFANDKALHTIEVRIAVHIHEARRNCIEVGHCLCEAKDKGLVPHGQWEDWVKANTGMTPRNAQRLMKAAREVPAGSVMTEMELAKIMPILALPADEREEMAERVIAEDMTVKQLKEAIDRERKRSDRMIEKYNQANNERIRQQTEIEALKTRAEAEKREYRDQQRESEQEHRREIGALRLQLQEALAAPAGMSPEAQARIDQLTSELAEAEAYAAEQARLRKEAQAELLNTAMAQPDAEGRSAGFGPENLEAAVRAFLGEVGVMMYMDAELAAMGDTERNDVRRQLAMVGGWLSRIQELLDKRAIAVE